MTPSKEGLNPEHPSPAGEIVSEPACANCRLGEAGHYREDGDERLRCLPGRNGRYRGLFYTPAVPEPVPAEGAANPESIEDDPTGEYTVDTHKLGTCLRFANGETCIGCGDKKNGEPLEEPKWIECPMCNMRFADATGTAHDLSLRSAAPIAPAAQEVIEELAKALQELVDDLPEDRCASSHCGGDCGVRRRAEAALSSAESYRKESEAQHGR